MADRSNAVNSKLQLRRDHIEELNSVRCLLAKLQAVFNLPQRLQAALDAGAVELAVDYYADAAPLLKRYRHKVGSLDAARTSDSHPLSKRHGNFSLTPEATLEYHLVLTLGVA